MISREELLVKLQLCVDDPMWADHVEMPKQLIRIVIEELTRHAQRAPSAPMVGAEALADEIALWIKRTGNDTISEVGAKQLLSRAETFLRTFSAVTSTPDWWIFEHQDGQRFFADKDIQHGKMAANSHWGENKWTRKPLFAGSAVTSTDGGAK